MNADKVVRAIKEAGRVVEALIQLGLKVGTLIAVVKMLVDAIN